MISASKLVKNFGAFCAVNEIELQIQRGECFGLLGPNGAGKSTLIGMLYGVNRRTSGNLKVLGLDPDTHAREIKKKIGVVTQDNALDESLSVKENMLIYAAFVGVKRADRETRVNTLLDYMNLSHKAEAKIISLSGGMQRRLVFVRALLATPELVVLDEPTTGLDPAVRHLLWGKVKSLRAEGTTVLITTHYMHEAEILCDRVAIMDHGKIRAIASPRELIATHTPGYVAVFSREGSDEPRLRELGSKALDFSSDSSGFYLRAKTFDELLEIQSHSQVKPLQLRPANLEDVFLKLTGQELSADA